MWRRSPADKWLIQVKPVFEEQEATILSPGLGLGGRAVGLMREKCLMRETTMERP